MHSRNSADVCPHCLCNKCSRISLSGTSRSSINAHIRIHTHVTKKDEIDTAKTFETPPARRQAETGKVGAFASVAYFAVANLSGMEGEVEVKNELGGDDRSLLDNFGEEQCEPDLKLGVARKRKKGSYLREKEKSWCVFLLDKYA